jgi:hypothetical protein
MTGMTGMTGIAGVSVSAMQDEWDVALRQVTAQGIAILAAPAVIQHRT